jgi:glycerol-1-phosphate dehydrogenase [NAD(P)+]
MTVNIPYQVCQDAVPAVIQYCAERNFRRLFLIADGNTYRVLGQRVEQALASAGIDIKTILLTGEEISTDEHYVTQTMIESMGEDRQYLAVGSGTVTDITRFVSHRARAGFISMPTAASVDGYTSTVAPMVVSKYKGPIPAQPPLAVFVDLPTAKAAPKIMTAAGLGDLLGKYTSLADWQLGQLLYDERYDEAVDHLMRDSVDKTVAMIDEVAQGTDAGITQLMDGLVGSGFGMLQFGDSRPASGSEHHIAHYWEMKFILDGRPAVLHGVKVGIATVIAARRYAQLRRLTYAEAAQRLENFCLPSRDAFLSEIEAGYGIVKDKIVDIQTPLLSFTPGDVMDLKHRILAGWDQIQAIAQGVPDPAMITRWIKAVAGPTEPADIDIDAQDVTLALRSAHYLRDRFTLNRLAFWLSMD